MRAILAGVWLAMVTLGSSTAMEPASSVAVPREVESQSGVQPPAPAPGSTAAAPAEDPILAGLRGLLEDAGRAKEAKDFAGARTRIAEAIERALAELAGREDVPACALLEQLGGFAHESGELRAAEKARRRVLEIRSRTLPDEHADLQAARRRLAATIGTLGDAEGARALFEKVLEVDARTLPDEHPDLQKSRLGLATTRFQLGDLQGARALFEKALAVCSRTLPEGHHDLQKARLGLAATMFVLGDLQGARALGEKTVEVCSRTLPDEHPDLQQARLVLAGTLYQLGDLQSARALFEKVLEVRSRTLPDEHPDVQAARENLALTMRQLGDLQGARVLEEKALAAYSRTLPDEHPDLQATRLNLAATMKFLGDLEGARALEERVLDVRERTLPDDHPDLQATRANLAVTMKLLGDLRGARALEERVLEVLGRTLPGDHPDLQMAGFNLAMTLAGLHVRRAGATGDGGSTSLERERDRGRCSELLLGLCRAGTQIAREALFESSVREAQARCEFLAGRLDDSLSFGSGYGSFEPIPALDRAAFVLSETTRGAALGAAALMRRAASAPQYSSLREAMRRASDDLASLAQKGTTSEEFQAVLRRRDRIQRDLATLARELAGGTPAGLDFDVDVLASRLSEKEVLVGFRRYVHWSLEASTDGETADSTPIVQHSVASLCALVLRRGPDGTAPGEPSSLLTRVELGPIAPIEEAVKAWRGAVGAGLERGLAAGRAEADVARVRGIELRHLLFDPLLPALGDADRIVVALDDVLHLVPIEALPLDPGPSGDSGDDALVGERWRIEARCTLAELLAPSQALQGADVLVALGGASFNSEPIAPSAEEKAAVGEAVNSAGKSPEKVDPILRGGAWQRGFAPLTYTGLEAREIAAIHGEVFDDKGVHVVLEKSKASRAALLELAPKARWLHVATHGWFASESIRSWEDPEPIDRGTGLTFRASGEEQIRGMSPMLLCGLALAGANLPADELGRVPGLITAEELSTLDLSNCELAVLSACDTNVGERRAGQGVASLQMALQMAGARSVITSLWKVSDEATRELMTEFYRRLWVEKRPKGRALWEAKMKMREAKDESGQPRYTTREWAAWVLTGEPE